MTTETLLPNNSTPTERALEVALRPAADVPAGVEAIRVAKETPPDDWLYWLIWEYGLEVLLPYLDDPRSVLERGMEWQRIRGTPDSLSIAFGWIGLGDTLIEEESVGGRHWFEYMLDPGRVPSRAELRKLVGLARLSQPLRSRLARIYHGLDLRRAVWDETKWSDGSLWSDYGGVYDPELGVDISFGRTEQFVAVLGPIQVYARHSRDVTSLVEYIDKMRWDECAYDDEYFTINPGFGGERLSTVYLLGPGRNVLCADGRFIADGSMHCGDIVDEFGQYPATITRETIEQLQAQIETAITATQRLYDTINIDFRPRLYTDLDAIYAERSVAVAVLAADRFYDTANSDLFLRLN